MAVPRSSMTPLRRCPAAAGIDDLFQEATARDFGALAHCKFIDRAEAAIPLLQKAGISGDDLDEGCVVLAAAKDTKAFADGLADCGFWGREPDVKMPW